jgi:hypothetical protein
VISSRCRNLDGSNASSSAVSDVGNVLTAQRGVDAENAVCACRLVADAQVQGALLIDTNGADGVENVPETVVLGDPAVRLADAGSDEVHAVGGGECKLAIRVVEKVRALVHVNGLVLHVNTTAHGRVDSSVLAGDESVPCIVAHVVSTSRLVDTEKMERAALVADLDTHVIAANTHRPIGNSVGVDLASEDTNAGGELDMRSGRDSASLLKDLLSGKSSCSGSENAQNGGDRELHVV